MVTWYCLMFSFALVPTLTDILGVKFDSRLTFEDHMHVIVSPVSQRIAILRLVKRVFVDTSVLLRCYLHLFSKSLSIVLRCGGLLLNAIFSFSSARCIRWPGFALIRLSCRCVINVMLLHCAPPGGSKWIISVGDYADNSFTALGSSDPREVRL